MIKTLALMAGYFEGLYKKVAGSKVRAELYIKSAFVREEIRNGR
jgi:hypothetical protein